MGCASRNPSAGSDATNMSTGTSLPENMKLRLPPAVFDARDWPTKLREAVAHSNEKARLDGLPDHLNPQIIDAAKAEAFLRALSQRPAEELRPFAGRTLALNVGHLMIDASAPTRPETFSQPFQIEIADVQGDIVHARLALKADCALARQRATEARSQFQAADEEVRALESRAAKATGSASEPQAVDAVSKAGRRRAALAHAWRENAEAFSKCPEADPSAKSDFDAASRAVNSYGLLMGSGMP
jgi:hypothetical protein